LALGARAIGKTLLTYQGKHGDNTPRKIILRWAPPVENDTNAYINDFAKALGLGPDDTSDLRQVETLAKAIGGIIHHENGTPPSAWPTFPNWLSEIDIRGGASAALGLTTLGSNDHAS
jgi:hypothetical protein